MHLANGVIEQLKQLMAERNVYRGRVLELRSRHFHDDEGAPLTVRSLPAVTRDRIVLPEAVLERIERQAFSVAKHATRLRAAGRHLRRGLLLHGPPGVGKTLTAMYLAAQMPERTVVLLTGEGFDTLGPSVDLAHSLQPAMLILEDVDLVALDRSFDQTNPVLMELLNRMDGLDEDSDLLFVLATNRADVLEAALTARPGRIDQAVALPLPDAEGRSRLITLYGEGLDLRLDRRDELVQALGKTSAAFIRELLRRGATRRRALRRRTRGHRPRAVGRPRRTPINRQRAHLQPAGRTHRSLSPQSQRRQPPARQAPQLLLCVNSGVAERIDNCAAVAPRPERWRRAGRAWSVRLDRAECADAASPAEAAGQP